MPFTSLPGWPRVRVRLSRFLQVGVSALAIGVGLDSPAWATPFADPLVSEAKLRTGVAARPFMAVAQAGRRLVAVGARGMIAVSDDQGQRWRQSPVPVQSDLLAVHFPTASHGWAVGHDGVILHSADSGTTWRKQLDGVQAAVAFKGYYAQLAQGSDAAENERIQKSLATLDQNFKAGPALPYLDVWFTDANTGYVVGAFGMFATTRDGGKSWLPALHRLDNADQLNLNTIRELHGRLFIAAERGRIFQAEPGAERFTVTSSGYTGSFFGLAGNEQAMLAFGLRGVVYRSVDQGQSWAPVAIPGGSSIAAGTVCGEAKGFVLANAAGQLIGSNGAATAFRLLGQAHSMRYTGVACLDHQSVLTTGFAGIHVRRLAASALAID